MLLAFVSLLIARKGVACDCDKIVSRDESKIVFTGQVKRVTESEEGFGYRIVIKVAKRIKGENKKKRIIVYTPCLEDICCGVPFKKGEYFFVVTIESKGILYANRCTATVPTTKEDAYD